MSITAQKIKSIVENMDEKNLIGYIYLRYISPKNCSRRTLFNNNEVFDIFNANQFLLEYVHAILPSTKKQTDSEVDLTKTVELFSLSEKLRKQALAFAIHSSINTKNGIFGPNTGEVEFHAKSKWVMLRGNRYQVLEKEFYLYVLTPHDEALKEVYGASAAAIAEGFQAIANIGPSGLAMAYAELIEQAKAVQVHAAAKGISQEDYLRANVAEYSEKSRAYLQAHDKFFRGGIANVSRHTQLPQLLLKDLSYQRGEDTDFFASGDFSGTPYRTLPARKKPLIEIDAEYYAIDFSSIRDSGYRSILYNILARKSDYKEHFELKQKNMSETAFYDILKYQLPDATVLNEIYYKDTSTGQWSENDTLIIFDDVLFLIEAKAGAAATIASPAVDFSRHARAIQDLVIKAYKQCDRFFRYLNSCEEVALYHLSNGSYKEVIKICKSDYRVMFPIGLTVESFSPFSTISKSFGGISPLNGKHAFFSLSIDDLFVLRRLLPTPGQFVHYMEVRQSVEAIPNAYLFDEFDHLGAYLENNRIDQRFLGQLQSSNANMLTGVGMSKVVDQAFEGDDWESRPFPQQDFPKEVLRLLEALDSTRSPGWLSAESCIRDLEHDARLKLGKILEKHVHTHDQYPYRYFALGGESQTILIWIEGNDTKSDLNFVKDKSSSIRINIHTKKMICIKCIICDKRTYLRADSFNVEEIKGETDSNAHIYADAARMKKNSQVIDIEPSKTHYRTVKQERIGRNDLCPCGSQKKYKHCHLSK